MREIKEWSMVQELMDEIDFLDTEEQKNFVQSLFDNLDPYLAFLDQQSEKQQNWLYVLHDYFVNGNTEAFDDYESD